MSSLRPPGLGPIVGHTEDTSCRIWIRAGDPDDHQTHLSSTRRTIGVIAIIAVNGVKVDNPDVHYFRLHREYDRTGTFVLGKDIGLDKNTPNPPLLPDTFYTARVATLTIDDPYPDDETVENKLLIKHLPKASEWRSILKDKKKLNGKHSIAEFQTFSDHSQISDHLSFILGSCRYPGMLWRAKHADRIFGPIEKQVSKRRQGSQAPKFVLMVGDQIYADKLSRYIPIGQADTFEEFQERYHTAFSSKNMRRLLRTATHYMILDDHEIEDNWSQDRFENGSGRLVFNLAINAYMSYQWCHGPRNFGNRLYYTFDCGGYPYFVLDTRTQRYLDDDKSSLDDNHMLGRPSLGDEPNQLSRLLGWLVSSQETAGNIPKFIVSSSVFVPNPINARSHASKSRKEKSDSWPGFPTTRKLILDCIIDNNIQNVVFLSGDIHCSNVAEIFFSGNDKVTALKAFSITSSAFYWPFPFADGEPSNYVHDSTTENQADSFDLSSGIKMDYKADNFTQEDNFCRIDIDRNKNQITVRAFNRYGNLVVEPTHSGKNKKIQTVLKLAEW